MFRASDIFGRGPGSAASVSKAMEVPTAAATANALPQKRGGPTTRVWDSATGKYIEEDLPADVQAMMGMQKRIKVEGPRGTVWGQTAAPVPGVKAELGAQHGKTPKLDKNVPSVEFKGFSKVDMNDRYYLKEDIVLNGKPTYWSADKQFFVYWQGEVNRWSICDAASVSAVRAGQYPGWAYKEDHKHLSNANGWLEAWAGSWHEPEIEVVFRSTCYDPPQWQEQAVQKTIGAVAFHGFAMRELNTGYYMRSEEPIQGRPSFWDKSGVYFIYWQRAMKRWAICDMKCIEAVRSGQCPGWAYRADSGHFANACGWLEQRSGEWTGAILESSVMSSSTKGLKVRLDGFGKEELNTTFSEKFDDEIQGRASFWDPSGNYFIYWQSSMQRWAVCDTASLEQAKSGLSPGWAYRTDSKHFAKATSWMEVWGRDWRKVQVDCNVMEGVVRDLAAVVKKELAEEGSSVKNAGAAKLKPAQYKSLIRGIYEDKNATKLSAMGSLMKKYDGREHDLFRQVCEKYDVDADQAVLDFLSAAEEDDPVPELSATEYALHIQTIYEKHNPKKLQDLARLLQKYRRRESELFQEVCKKYGEDPASFVGKSMEKIRHNVKGEQ